MLKGISFGLLGLLVFLLAAATIVEHHSGTAAASRYVYTAPWMIALWTLTALAGLIYLLRRRLYRRPGTLIVHLALAVILLGAGLTHYLSREGRMELVEGARALSGYMTEGDRVEPLPFSVALEKSETQYYPGTRAPMDYVSRLVLIDRDSTRSKATVSMNEVLSREGYRFYQTGIAPGRSTLTVTYDPIGIRPCSSWPVWLYCLPWFCAAALLRLRPSVWLWQG